MTYPRGGTICRLAAAATLAACLVSCTKSPAPPADSEVVVATVNGAPITLKDLKIEIARVRGVTPSVPARSGTRTEVSRALRQLVERTVVLWEGERYGVAVSDDEVEEEVRRFRADFPPGGLEKALLQEGIDAEEWREGLRRSLLYRKSTKAIVLPVAEVPEEEVKKVFEETFGKETQPERIRVRQRLFDSPEEAAGAREKIVGGASPDDVAKRFSAGEGPPIDVDLGFLTREELPGEVAAALFLLPAGGVSRVIPRDKTHSLFLVVQKSSSGSFSYAEKAPEIRKELFSGHREEVFRKWLEAEVAKADVRVEEK
ncbi:MAG TPA: peptidyl-prolyl cis-trans isomerase, partial [Candidatus Deferrimicrobiaceae bacterium]|nr:peptidyl-prolyl cis-trans isomerase [Candidatus Deferrimicrobiaceae bacterium]